MNDTTKRNISTFSIGETNIGDVVKMSDDNGSDIGMTVAGNGSTVGVAAVATVFEVVCCVVMVVTGIAV